MIPKIIHYTWFSGDPYPELIKQCIESWHKHLPDYEFRLWDYAAIKDIDSVWLRECLQEKKWAFAADFIRVYAVYHFGGIYLDTDCMVLQSLDPFLNDRLFIGRETGFKHVEEGPFKVSLTSHCFGAEKGHPFLKQNIEYYSNRHFIMNSANTLPKSMHYDLTIAPMIQCQIAELYGYNPSIRVEHTQKIEDGIVVYPSAYFTVQRFNKNPKINYVEHLVAGSWRERDNLEGSKPIITLRNRINQRLFDFISRILFKFGFVLSKAN